MTLHFSDVIIFTIMSALKSSQTSCPLATDQQHQIPGYFCLICEVKIGHSNYTTFPTVICKRFRMSGK